MQNVLVGLDGAEVKWTMHACLHCAAGQFPCFYKNGRERARPLWDRKAQKQEHGAPWRISLEWQTDDDVVFGWNQMNFLSRIFTSNQYSFILNFLQALFKNFAAVSMKTSLLVSTSNRLVCPYGCLLIIPFILQNKTFCHKMYVALYFFILICILQYRQLALQTSTLWGFFCITLKFGNIGSYTTSNMSH